MHLVTTSLRRSESSSHQIVGIGLDDIAAISTPDATLVVHKERSRDVKRQFGAQVEDIAHVEMFPKDHRPWTGLKV